MNSIKNKVDLLFSPKYLLYTNFALGGAFLAGGDLIEQYLNKKVVGKYMNDKQQEKLKEKPKDKKLETIDLDRVAAMGKSGLVIGLCGHFWYKFLDTRFPGKARATIIKKLACEMAIGPPWILITFMTVGFFEKQPVNEAFQKFKSNLLTVLAADWCFYVPLQSLNFKFIPPRYRFAYVCCLTVIYDIFLAFILHK